MLFQKRHVLEENNELEPRVSLLEADDFDLDDDEDEVDEDFEEKKKLAEMIDKAKQASKEGKNEIILHYFMNNSTFIPL